MKEKLVRFFEKAFWPAMICIGVAFMAMLMYQATELENQRKHYYRVDVNGQSIWTKEVTFDDGSVSFVNIENGRRYKVVGAEYVIIEPKK